MDLDRRTRTVHRCNGVMDPSTCCPVAHGGRGECDCIGCYQITEQKCSLGHWHETKPRERFWIRKKGVSLTENSDV